MSSMTRVVRYVECEWEQGRVYHSFCRGTGVLRIILVYNFEVLNIVAPSRALSVW